MSQRPIAQYYYPNSTSTTSTTPTEMEQDWIAFGEDDSEKCQNGVCDDDGDDVIAQITYLLTTPSHSVKSISNSPQQYHTTQQYHSAHFQQSVSSSDLIESCVHDTNEGKIQFPYDLDYKPSNLHHDSSISTVYQSKNNNQEPSPPHSFFLNRNDLCELNNDTKQFTQLLNDGFFSYFYSNHNDYNQYQGHEYKLYKFLKSTSSTPTTQSNQLQNHSIDPNIYPQHQNNHLHDNLIHTTTLPPPTSTFDQLVQLFYTNDQSLRCTESPNQSCDENSSMDWFLDHVHDDYWSQLTNEFFLQHANDYKKHCDYYRDE